MTNALISVPQEAVEWVGFRVRNRPVGQWSRDWVMCRPAITIDMLLRGEAKGVFYLVVRILEPTSGGAGSSSSSSFATMGMSGCVVLHLPFLNSMLLGLMVKLERRSWRFGGAGGFFVLFFGLPVDPRSLSWRGGECEV